MLLIKRTILIIISALLSVSLVFSAFFAYSKIMAAETLKGTELKFQAEQLLFIMLLISLIVIILQLLLIFRSRNIEKEIDKLIRHSRLNPASTEQGFLKLGRFGMKLSTLYSQLNSISEKRGLKISALSSLADFLSQHTDSRIIVTDITGRILYAGAGIIQQLNTSKTEIIGAEIGTVFEGLNVKELFSEIEKNKRSANAESSGISLRIHPVYDLKNTVEYIAFEAVL